MQKKRDLVLAWPNGPVPAALETTELMTQFWFVIIYHSCTYHVKFMLVPVYFYLSPFSLTLHSSLTFTSLTNISPLPLSPLLSPGFVIDHFPCFLNITVFIICFSTYPYRWPRTVTWPLWLQIQVSASRNSPSPSYDCRFWVASPTLLSWLRTQPRMQVMLWYWWWVACLNARMIITSELFNTMVTRVPHSVNEVPVTIPHFSWPVDPMVDIPELPTDTFDLMFTPDPLDNMVEQSNLYAIEVMGEQKY